MKVADTVWRHGRGGAAGASPICLELVQYMVYMVYMVTFRCRRGFPYSEGGGRSGGR